MNDITKIVIKTVLSIAVSFGVLGCCKSVEPAEIMSVKKMALDGYDPVAYFISSRAAKGGIANGYSYKELQWNFENSENLAAFKSSPQAYIPQLGGFCAYRLADEKLVLSDPKVWYIHNEKLYLFSDEEAKTKWYMNLKMMIEKGEKEWEAVMNPADEVKKEAAESAL